MNADMKIHQCPICSSTALQPFFKLENVPVFCNVLYEHQAEAKSCTRGDIHLAYCPICGFITNTTFDQNLISYTPVYENSLHFSTVFQNYADTLVDDLIHRYDLHSKTIIEIGAGQGDFLVQLCRTGNNHGIGFDPAYTRNTVPDAENGYVLFVRDTYSERYSHYKADLFCCRHVLEHIDEPRQLISAIKESADPDTALYFEVPNSAYTISKRAVWDIIYEHCSYFTSDSLQYVFTANGFRVQEIKNGFEDQYLSLYAVADRPSDHVPEASEKEPFYADLLSFQEQSNQLINSWNQQLQTLHHQRSRVVFWGAGSKGTMFLNSVKQAETISFVVDINPRKQNHFIPGTGQRIIAPEELRKFQPDVIILANPVYLQEVQDKLEHLQLYPQVKTL